MNKTFKLIAAMALLCLGSASASAGIIDFGFKNEGLLGGAANSCGTNCVELASGGLATSGTGETWLFSGKMKVFEGGVDVGFGAGPGLGWSFTDLDGTNNLFGSFTAVGDLLSWAGGGAVQYTVLGGSGIFAGAVGSGVSTIWTDVVKLGGYYFGGFREEGRMTVWANPAAVPEPAVSTLLIAGFGMLAILAYRRRRATRL